MTIANVIIAIGKTSVNNPTDKIEWRDPQDDPDLVESSKPVSTDPSDPWWQHPYIIWGVAIGAIAFVVAVTWIF